jgi:hypothetical protein
MICLTELSPFGRRITSTQAFGLGILLPSVSISHNHNRPVPLCPLVVYDHSCSNLLASPRGLLLIIILLLMLASRDPGITVLILATEIHTLLSLLPPLAQSPGALGDFALDGSILLDPVGEGVFAVLDDGLAGLVAIVGIAGLAWCDWGVIDELEQVLAVAGDDGEFLAVFAESVELVGECCLQLLARDVGELGFGDQRFCFRADELLFEDNDLGAIGFFVLELSDLVGDLLLA